MYVLTYVSVIAGWSGVNWLLIGKEAQVGSSGLEPELEPKAGGLKSDERAALMINENNASVKQWKVHEKRNREMQAFIAKTVKSE